MQHLSSQQIANGSIIVHAVSGCLDNVNVGILWHRLALFLVLDFQNPHTVVRMNAVICIVLRPQFTFLPNIYKTN